MYPHRFKLNSSVTGERYTNESEVLEFKGEIEGLYKSLNSFSKKEFPQEIVASAVAQGLKRCDGQDPVSISDVISIITQEDTCSDQMKLATYHLLFTIGRQGSPAMTRLVQKWSAANNNIGYLPPEQDRDAYDDPDDDKSRTIQIGFMEGILLKKKNEIFNEKLKKAMKKKFHFHIGNRKPTEENERCLYQSVSKVTLGGTEMYILKEKTQGSQATNDDSISHSVLPTVNNREEAMSLLVEVKRHTSRFLNFVDLQIAIATPIPMEEMDSLQFQEPGSSELVGDEAGECCFTIMMLCADDYYL
jgi:hypothetical protein